MKFVQLRLKYENREKSFCFCHLPFGVDLCLLNFVSFLTFVVKARKQFSLAENFEGAQELVVLDNLTLNIEYMFR